MPKRGVRALPALAVLACVCGVVLADDSKSGDPATDAELLEFLGSVDSGVDSQTAADDDSWIEYLSETDIGKVAKTADPSPGGSRAKQVAVGTQPPVSGDK